MKTKKTKTRRSLKRVVSLTPGSRYTKDGISLDVDFVKDGQVYLRRWPKGVESQPMFENCVRVPIADFIEQVQDATMEANESSSAH